MVFPYIVMAEFFNDKDQLEFYVAKQSDVCALIVPNKMTKKIEKCFEAAKAENEVIVTVREVSYKYIEHYSLLFI